MTTKRASVLFGILLGGFSMVFILPTKAHEQPVGIALKLPEFVGDWYGADQAVTPQERQVLAGDTEFARKVYTNGAGDIIFASIVLSGHDPENSIHRPERCLPAQGWTVVDSRIVSIPSGEANTQPLEVTRLRNTRQMPLGDRVISRYNLNYYWFVGFHHVTASHFRRTFLDIQDRVLKGYNQRWAYLTVAGDITEGLTRFGKPEKETDAMIQGFIAQLYPKLETTAPNGEALSRP